MVAGASCSPGVRADLGRSMPHTKKWDPVSHVKVMSAAATLKVSTEGQIILKDKFITQCVPDTKRKLFYNKAFCPDTSSLDNLVRVAPEVFLYPGPGGDQGKRERRSEGRALVVSLWGSPTRFPGLWRQVICLS